jgi:hypothetical protein
MGENNDISESIFTSTHTGLHGIRQLHVFPPGAKFLKSCFLPLFLAGCACVPKDYMRTESTAFPDYLDTSVGQLFEEAAIIGQILE